MLHLLQQHLCGLIIVVYTYNIILMAPSVHAVQLMLFISEMGLTSIGMCLNVNRSICLRFGRRFNTNDVNLVAGDDRALQRVGVCRYIGIHLVASRHFIAIGIIYKSCFCHSCNAVYE